MSKKRKLISIESDHESTTDNGNSSNSSNKKLKIKKDDFTVTDVSTIGTTDNVAPSYWSHPFLKIRKSEYGRYVYTAKKIIAGEVVMLEDPVNLYANDFRLKELYPANIKIRKNQKNLSEEIIADVVDYNCFSYEPIKVKPKGKGAAATAAHGKKTKTKVKVGKYDTSLVFLNASMFNHSCTPNATFHFVGSEKKIIKISALTDIEEGDEVTISYVGLYGVRHSKKGRQKDLENWFKKCGCPICLKPYTESSEQKMKKILAPLIKASDVIDKVKEHFTGPYIKIYD